MALVLLGKSVNSMAHSNSCPTLSGLRCCVLRKDPVKACWSCFRHMCRKQGSDIVSGVRSLCHRAEPSLPWALPASLNHGCMFAPLQGGEVRKGISDGIELAKARADISGGIPQVGHEPGQPCPCSPNLPNTPTLATSPSSKKGLQGSSSP